MKKNMTASLLHRGKAERLNKQGANKLLLANDEFMVSLILELLPHAAFDLATSLIDRRR